MRKLLLLLILVSVLGCSKPVVVKYCPSPVKPVLTDPKTVGQLLDNYNNVVIYTLGLESQVKCYEGFSEENVQ